ncbi:hypothetical protein GBA52_026233 [Prunus armeniaca]|nr:hypothetical protein GBA52_026233 [Prunus armeniaca]
MHQNYIYIYIYILKSRHFLFHFCSSPLYRTLTKPSAAITSIFSISMERTELSVEESNDLPRRPPDLLVEENNDLVVLYDFEKSESLYMVSSVPFLCDFLISRLTAPFILVFLKFFVDTE